MMRRRCLWCRRPLEFRSDGAGWVHEDTGQTYETYIGPDGQRRDHHCATPDMSDAGALDGR
jgi:hypothetical protein